MKIGAWRLLCVSIAALCLGIPPREASGALDILPELAVLETYTDNLFFTEQDREEDFGTFVVPQLALRYDRKDLTVSGAYSGAAQFFINNPGENAYAQTGTFNVDYRRPRFNVRVFESFALSPQQEAFSFVGDPGGSRFFSELRGIFRYLRPRTSNQGFFTTRITSAFFNTAGFRLAYDLTPTLSPSFNYSNSLRFFDSDDFIDSQTHSMNLSLNYRRSPRTSWRTTYGAAVTDFEDRDGFVSHRASLGVRHDLAPRLIFDGTAGGSLTEGSLRFDGQASLAYSYKQGTLFLRLSQNINTAGGFRPIPTLNQSLVTAANHSFTRLVSGFLLLGVARNEALSGSDFESIAVQVSTGLERQFLDWLAGTLSYSFILQDVEGFQGGDAHRNQVFVGLKILPPPLARPFLEGIVD